VADNSEQRGAAARSSEMVLRVNARIVELLGHLPWADQGEHVRSMLAEGHTWAVIKNRNGAILRCGFLYKQAQNDRTERPEAEQ